MAAYSKHPDSELASLLREGDHAAFEEIYERYYRLLYLYAVRKLPDDNEARDTVQDVFLGLWNQHGQFNLRTTLSAYLYKSTLNRIYDTYRRKDIFQRYLEAGEYYLETDSEQTDYLLDEVRIAALITREVAAMPPRMREIYELKYQQLLSTRDIAVQLGLSEHTVSTQLKRALRHLRLRLGIFTVVVFILGQPVHENYHLDNQQIEK